MGAHPPRTAALAPFHVLLREMSPPNTWLQTPSGWGGGGYHNVQGTSSVTTPFAPHHSHILNKGYCPVLSENKQSAFSQNSVCCGTPRISTVSFPLKQIRISSFSRGNQFGIRESGNSDGSPRTSTPGLLFQIFPSSKEGWLFTFYLGSQEC